MRKHGLFTLAFMLMLPFSAIAADSTTAPPGVTMESATGGSGGRVIGGPASAYDGAEAGTIRIQWPYVYHGTVRKCQINAATMSCQTYNSGCSYATPSTVQIYMVSLEGVRYRVQKRESYITKNAYGMATTAYKCPIRSDTKYWWSK